MRRLGWLILLTISGGCSLITDFSGVAGDSAGASDSGPDVAVADAAEAASDSAESGPNDASDAADAGPNCPDASALGGDYVLRRLPPSQVVALDGDCSEAFWAALPEIPFAGVDSTDNQLSCRIAWAEGAPSRVYGCCQVQDSDLRASVTVPDDPVWKDDAFETFFSGNTLRSYGDTTSKHICNLLSVSYDVDFTPSDWDQSFDSQPEVGVKLTGTLNNSSPDTGYTLEWGANLAFSVQAPMLGLCSFMLDDSDVNDSGASKFKVAFGSDVNNVNQWGTCLFSCEAP